MNTPIADALEHAMFPGSQIEPLNLTDACDRCGATTMVRLRKGELVIDFCGHHFRVNVDALTMQGWLVHEDKRRELV